MTEYITLPVMGALIGYGTNWLAIKMVFRPYEEKRIFGLKVPFTPGVMAKERYNFSKKLGDTLSDNVITDEELAKYFQNIDFNKISQNLLDDINVDKPLSAFITDDKIVQALNASLKEIIKSSLSEEKSNIAKFMLASVKSKLNSENIEGILSKEEQIELINSFKNNDEVFRVANNLVSNVFRKAEFLDKPLSEVFGEDVVSKISTSIDSNGDRIRLALLEYVKSEDFKYLEEKIEELVSAGIGKIPIASMFGGSALGKMVTPILVENIIEYLEDVEHNEEIVEVVNNLLDTLLKTDSKKALDFVSQDIVYMSTQKIIVEACNAIAETVKNGTSTFEYKSIFKDMVNVLETKLEGFTVDAIDKLSKDDEKLEFISSTVVSKVLDIKLGIVVKSLGGEVSSQIGNLLKVMIDKNLGRVLQQINISEIVENKINTFEMKEAEKLVIGVMNKELKMITNLGGVLGFIIGSLSIFI